MQSWIGPTSPAQLADIYGPTLVATTGEQLADLTGQVAAADDLYLASEHAEEAVQALDAMGSVPDDADHYDLVAAADRNLQEMCSLARLSPAPDRPEAAPGWAPPPGADHPTGQCERCDLTDRLRMLPPAGPDAPLNRGHWLCETCRQAVEDLREELLDALYQLGTADTDADPSEVQEVTDQRDRAHAALTAIHSQPAFIQDAPTAQY